MRRHWIAAHYLQMSYVAYVKKHGRAVEVACERRGGKWVQCGDCQRWLASLTDLYRHVVERHMGLAPTVRNFVGLHDGAAGYGSAATSYGTVAAVVAEEPAPSFNVSDEKDACDECEVVG